MQQLRGEIYANSQVLQERSDDEGTFFMVRSEADVVKKIRQQLGLEPIDEPKQNEW